jgi:hypothetical protein
MRKFARRVAIVALAGALVAVAAPAAAQAEPPKGSEPPVLSGQSVLSASDLSGLQYRLVGLRNLKSQKFLQPVNGSTANGARIVQMPFTGLGIQAWYEVPDGSYFSFWNYASRLNMGIDGASTAADRNAIQANPAGHANQDWLKVFRAAQPGVFNLRNRHSNLCLGIDGASTNDGARAAQYACNYTALNQGWQATN